MSEKVRLRIIDDPILREVSAPVNLPDDYTFVVGLIETMNEAMKALNGMGLAANQIGQAVQIFILKKGDSYTEHINPEVTEQSDLVTFEKEGCLSIPGAYGSTKRYNKIGLTWVDRHGIKSQGTFEGIDAFAVQHEMDHLNGKLYVDQLSPLMRKMTLKKHTKFLKGY